jgi:hypothetical protein
MIMKVSPVEDSPAPVISIDLDTEKRRKAGMASFTARPGDASKASWSCWMKDSVLSMTNWVVPGLTEREYQEPLLSRNVPLLRAEIPGAAKRTGQLCIEYTQPAACGTPDPEDPVQPAPPFNLLQVARTPQKTTFVSGVIAFGNGMMAGVEAASKAAVTDAFAKTKTLLGLTDERNVEDASRNLLRSVIVLHDELSTVPKPAGSLANRAANALKDLVPRRDVIAASSATVVTFWECVDKVQNPGGPPWVLPKPASPASTPHSPDKPTDSPEEDEHPPPLGPEKHVMAWAASYESALRDLGPDELATFTRAINDENVRSALMTELQSCGLSSAARQLVITMRQAAEAETKSRYIEGPFADLTTSKSVNQSTGNPLAEILRGFYSDIARPDESLNQYLSRLVRLYKPDMQRLREALEPTSAVISELRKNDVNPMTAQYMCVVDELRTIVDAEAATGNQEAQSVLHRRPWPTRKVAAAKPTHSTGVVRRAASALAFWLQYPFASASSQARMRTEYLEKRIDAEVSSLKKTLAFGKSFDHNAARIESRLRQLHEAVDDLHTELSLQDSSRSANEYMIDALHRSLQRYDKDTLKKLWPSLAEDNWEPNAPSAPVNRLHKMVRHIARTLNNPFLDSRKDSQLMMDRPLLQARVTATWAALQTMIEDEPNVRDIQNQLQQLADHLDTKLLQKKDYGAISLAVGRLIELDAQRGADRNTRIAAFKPALKRLPPEALNLLMRRLHKYSAQSGEEMIGFIKPTLPNARVAPEDQWFYARLLEDLYTAGLTLHWTAPANTDAGALPPEPAEPFAAADASQERSSPQRSLAELASSSIALTTVKGLEMMPRVLSRVH